MSQKQAISQTPIDLTPEDEAKPQNAERKSLSGSGRRDARRGRAAKSGARCSSRARTIAAAHSGCVRQSRSGFAGQAGGRPATQKRGAGAARPHVAGQ